MPQNAASTMPSSTMSHELSTLHPHLSTTPTLFLDIDGVLAVPSAKQVRRKHWYDESTYPFTPACVKLLNALLRTTGAEIVLSSTWRLHYTLPELDAIFRWNGAIRTPMDITPEMGNRDVEIRHFVQEHQIQQFLIIDDLPLTCYPDRFVQTNSHRGITQADLLRGIEILDSQEG